MKKNVLVQSVVGVLGVCFLAVQGCGSRSGTLVQGGGTPLSRSYSYTLKISGFIGPPVTNPVNVTVRDGRAVSMEPVNPTDTIDRTTLSRYDTIDKINAIITSAKKTADRVDVTYDPTTGIPSDVYIDYIKLAADDELGITVRNYKSM